MFADLTWDIHTFLPEHIFAYFLWNIPADIHGHSSTVVYVESVAELVDGVMTVFLGLVFTHILSAIFVLSPRESGTFLPRNNRALFPGDILAVDIGYNGAAFSGGILAGSALHISALLSRLAALLLQHPRGDLLVHLATLPVQGNPGLPPHGQTRRVTLLLEAGLAHLVRHHLVHLIHLSLALETLLDRRIACQLQVLLDLLHMVEPVTVSCIFKSKLV